MVEGLPQQEELCQGVLALERLRTFALERFGIPNVNSVLSSAFAPVPHTHSTSVLSHADLSFLNLSHNWIVEILAFGNLRRKRQQFMASLGNLVKLYLEREERSGEEGGRGEGRG